MPREIGWRKLNSACVMTRALVPLGFDKSNIVTSFGAEIIRSHGGMKMDPNSGVNLIYHGLRSGPVKIGGNL